MGYQIWYYFSKEKVNPISITDWKENVCFSWLRDSGRRVLIVPFLTIRFKNKLGLRTKKWCDQLKEWGLYEFVDIVTKREFYYVTIDLRGVSYILAFFLLTFLRYPGESEHICKQTYIMQKLCPNLSFWEAFYLAHQYKLIDIYSVPVGHTVFKCGNPRLPKNTIQDFLNKIKDEPVFIDGYETTNLQGTVSPDDIYNSILKISTEEFKERYAN